MVKLLKTEFFKVRKVKSVKIALLIAVVFAFINIFLMKIAEKFMGNLDIPEGFNFSFDATGRSVFLNSFSLFNNFGIIIPIIICIYVGQEFSYGTIRNKLIAGAKRYEIYLANAIIASIFGLVLFLVYAGIGLLLSFPILGYGKTFNTSEFFFVLKVFGLGCLLFLFSISLSVFLTFILKNQAFALLANIIIMMVGSAVMTLAGLNGNLDKVFTFIPFYQALKLTTGIIDSGLVLKIVITNILLIGALNLGGILVFKKADLK